MKSILSDLNFDHWQAILLSGIPALLNLFIFFYFRSICPDNKVSRIFSMFLLALVVYQLGDTFLRMSGTQDTAIVWNVIFMPGVLFVMPFGLHFSMVYTGRKKIADSFLFQFLNYTPAVVLVILTFLNMDNQSYHESSFWGWTYKQKASSLGGIEGYWIGALGIIMLLMLLRHAFKTPLYSEERKQAIIIACGFSLPLAQGIFTEILLPVMSTVDSIPLTSSFMTFFSLSTLLALRNPGQFSVADSLDTQTMLEAITDMLIVLSPSNEIIYLNKAGEQILGLKNIEKNPVSIDSLFISKAQAETFIEKLGTLEKNSQIYDYAAEFNSKSRKRLSVLISATSFIGSNGKPQVLLLIHNVSEQIQTSEQLVLREEQLKEKKEELNAFFYRTTHDLKGPIASIIGLTHLAKKETDAKMVNMCVDKIEQSATRLDGILLDFIKIMQIKERQTEIQLINFYKLTDTIVQSIKYSTGPDIVDFKVWVEPNIIFHCDEKLIDTILYNLVANAVNYRKQNNEEDPYVYVQIRNFSNGVLIKVADNGIGIKKDIQSKIFNLFFRGTEDSKGAGLGLYILKNALDKLNGRIELESEINKGSTFSVYLPDLNPAMPAGNLQLVYSSAS